MVPRRPRQGFLIVAGLLALLLAGTSAYLAAREVQDSMRQVAARALQDAHAALAASERRVIDATRQLPAQFDAALRQQRQSLRTELRKEPRAGGGSNPTAAMATQGAVIAATMADASSPVGARMVNFRGHSLLVVAPKNDEYVGAGILASGTPFAPAVLGRLLDFVRPGSTVVDAGANLGSYTIFLAAAAGPRGRVHAFEPQRRMFQVLCTNSIVNGLINIVPHHAALSFGPDVVHMSSKVRDGSSAGLDLAAAEEAGARVNYGGMTLGAGGEAVRAVTLDSFRLSNVSLIKVDVQGAEKLMFWGAQDTIRRNLPVILYEDTGDYPVTADMNATMHIPDEVHAFNISSFLRALGYSQAPAPAAEDTLMLPPAQRRRARA